MGGCFAFHTFLLEGQGIVMERSWLGVPRTFAFLFCSTFRQPSLYLRHRSRRARGIDPRHHAASHCHSLSYSFCSEHASSLPIAEGRGGGTHGEELRSEVLQRRKGRKGGNDPSRGDGVRALQGRRPKVGRLVVPLDERGLMPVQSMDKSSRPT